MIPIDSVNGWAERWAAFMWGGLIDSAVALAVVGTIWLGLRRRASPRLGCWLFLLVLLRLVVPIEVTVPGPLAYVSPQHSVRQLTHPDTDDATETLRPEPPPEVGDDRALETVVRRDDTRRRTFSAGVPSRSAIPADAPPPPAVGPELSVASGLMIGWTAVVLGLFALFAYVQWRTFRWLCRAEPVDPDALPVRLDELLRLAGVRGAVRVVRSPRVPAPAVWGLVRPRLVLPIDFEETLSTGQMRWVLLHELTHVRCRDLWTSAFQRVVQIFYFFNPLVWLTNWLIVRHREYACDDAALAACQQPRRDSGVAFLAIAERAGRRPALLEPALGAFQSKHFFRRRLVRILDTKRPVRARLGLASVLLLSLTGLVLLPHVRAEEERPATDVPAKSEAAPAKPAVSSDDPAVDVPPRVQELIEQLSAPDSEKRAEAAGQLGDMGKWAAGAVPALVQTLRDDAPLKKAFGGGVAASRDDVSGTVGYRAALALWRIGPQTVEPLLTAIEDDDWKMRRMAAYALGGTGDARAVAPLIAALDDQEPRVTGAAVSALAGIDDSRIAPALVRVLGDKDVDVHVRRDAIWGLSRQSDPAAAEALLAVLQDRDDDQDLRVLAAFWLAESKQSRAVEPLIAILQDPDANRRVRVEAARVLGGLGDRRATMPLVAALEDEDKDIRGYAAGSLGRLKDPRALEPLVLTLQDQNAWTARIAAQALGEMGNPLAVPALTMALDAPDEWVRYSAAEALGRIDTPGAAVPLIAALSDKAPEVREMAVEQLRRMNTPDVVEPLIGALADEQASVRSKAAIALAELDDSRAVGPLVAALERDVARGGPYTSGVMFALGEFRAQDAVEPLIAALDENNPFAAVGALGKLGDRRAVGPLVELLNKDYVALQAYTAEALGRIDDRRIVSTLLARLEGDDPTRRRGALLALAYLGDARAAGPLTEILDPRNGHPWRVRNRAARALGYVDDPAVVDTLLTLFENEAHFIVEASLAHGLGATEDARVVGPLIAALKHQSCDVRTEAAIGLGRIGDARAVGPLTAALDVEEGIPAMPEEIERLRKEVRRALVACGEEAGGVE